MGCQHTASRWRKSWFVGGSRTFGDRHRLATHSLQSNPSICNRGGVELELWSNEAGNVTAGTRSWILCNREVMQLSLLQFCRVDGWIRIYNYFLAQLT